MRQEYLADLASGGSLATLALLFPQTHLCKGGTSAKACQASLPIFPSLYRRTNSPSLATSFFSQGMCFLWGPHHGPCEVPVSARRGIEVRPTDPQNWKCTTTFGRLPLIEGCGLVFAGERVQQMQASGYYKLSAHPCSAHRRMGKSILQLAAAGMQPIRNLSSSCNNEPTSTSREDNPIDVNPPHLEARWPSF